GRPAGGLPRSCASTLSTARLPGSPPATTSPPGPPDPSPRRAPQLTSRFTLERGLPLLVQVFHARDVLDGAPGRPRTAAHGVHQGLADLVFGGAGLLRSREAARHSGRAAGRGHGGQRDQLQGLGIESAFTLIDSGELLHLAHRSCPPRVEVLSPGIIPAWDWMAPTMPIGH